MTTSIKQISHAEVLEVLQYSELIPQMEKALSRFSASDSGVDQPVRTMARVRPQNGVLGVMPVYSQYDGVLTTKVVTFFPNNKTELTHNSLILVFDSTSGVPKAIVNGDVITEMRTAAVSAVATKYLSLPEADVMAIIGAGVQARSHFHALSHLFKFKEVRIWSRNVSNAEKLAKEINGRACKSVEEAVKDADIINTVTSSSTPVIKLEWIKPGAHINGVGACLPDWHEIDPKIMQSAIVYVDSRDAAIKESGDIIIGKAEIYAEIGEVINGIKEAKREKTTVFKSLGLAIEDGLSAQLVLEKLE